MTAVLYPTAVYPPTTTTTTTTKSVTTRVLDPTTLPREVPVEPTSSVVTRASSSSTTASSSSTSTEAPPIVPTRRVIHRVARRLRTPSGYYSSDLDYGKRKTYHTDYKYRHYYCCNLFRGRWDLHNRSYGCCEWFYGCPIWAYLLLALLLLALIVTFFTLFGLQPSVNSSRWSDTAQTRLLNRTLIIYGFYRLCGYQVNSTVVQTTLILCTNTATTSTARIELSSFYTVLNRTDRQASFELHSLFILIFLRQFLFDLLRVN